MTYTIRHIPTITLRTNELEGAQMEPLAGQRCDESPAKHHWRNFKAAVSIEGVWASLFVGMMILGVPWTVATVFFGAHP